MAMMRVIVPPDWGGANAHPAAQTNRGISQGVEGRRSPSDAARVGGPKHRPTRRRPRLLWARRTRL
jgi:hypothetical protein